MKSPAQSDTGEKVKKEAQKSPREIWGMEVQIKRKYREKSLT